MLCRLCRTLASAVVLSLIIFSPSISSAEDPPVLPGWVKEQIPSDPSAERAGVVLPAGTVTFSAPAIDEINGNSADGREVAIATSDGRLNVFTSNGTLLWTKTLPSNAVAGSRTNKLLSSPSIANLFGDGVPYVLVGYGGIRSGGVGGVTAFRGADGVKKWDFRTNRTAKGERLFSVFSSPSVADTDGDGTMEVGFGGFTRKIYLLNANGKVRKQIIAADTVWSSAAFADLDGDGKLEMIIGTDISQNKKLNPPTINGGYVYAFKTSKGKKQIGFRDPTSYLWRFDSDQVIFSSPGVADVLPDNPGVEVVVQSGCFFPQRSSNKTGAWIKVLSGLTGKVLQTLPTEACASSSPAFGDLDGDGVSEIIATVNGSTSVGGDGSGYVVAFKASSTTPLWRTDPNPNESLLGNFRSPVVADIDGNGSLEVAVGSASRVVILNGIDGVPLTCQTRSCDVGSLVLSAGSTIQSTPAIGDINADGVSDVVIGAGQRVFSWTSFSGILGSTPGTLPAYSAPWPMFLGPNFARRAE